MNASAKVLHVLEDAHHEGPGLPGRTTSQLAELLDLDEPVVRRTIRQLERDGFVRVVATTGPLSLPVYGPVSKHDEAPHDPYLAGRQRYVRDKHRTMPNLTRHQELLKEHDSVLTMIKEGVW